MHIFFCGVGKLEGYVEGCYVSTCFYFLYVTFFKIFLCFIIFTYIYLLFCRDIVIKFGNLFMHILKLFKKKYIAILVG